MLGAPVARRLHEAGTQLSVFNRTASKAAALKESGVLVAETVDEILDTCHSIILVLSDYAAIEDCFLSRLRDYHSPEDTSVIQMGTISPAQSTLLSREIESHNLTYIEAPVLGSGREAVTGSLIALIGSNSEELGGVETVLATLTSTQIRVGTVGKAAALKLAMNQMLASLTAAFATSLAFTQRSDIDSECFMSVLRASASYAPRFDKQVDRLLERNYANPAFSLSHLAKDVDLFANAALQVGLDPLVLSGIQGVLRQAMSAGHESTDYSVMYEEINPAISNL